MRYVGDFYSYTEAPHLQIAVPEKYTLPYEGNSQNVLTQVAGHYGMHLICRFCRDAHKWCSEHCLKSGGTQEIKDSHLDASSSLCTSGVTR